MYTLTLKAVQCVHSHNNQYSVYTHSEQCSVYTCTVVSGQCTLSGAREINTAARLTPVVVASVRPVLHLQSSKEATLLNLI